MIDISSIEAQIIFLIFVIALLSLSPAIMIFGLIISIIPQKHTVKERYKSRR